MNRWPLSPRHILAVLWLALIASPPAAQTPDFREVFENHGVAMLLIAPASGQIVDANPAAARFYGHGRATLQAMSIQQINTLSAEQVAAERALAESEGRNFFIFRHQLANGEIRTVEVYSHPFVFDDRRLLLSMIHDITAGRNLDQGMWHYQERLEALVEARSAEAAARRHMVFLLLAGLLAAAMLSLTLFLAVRRRKRAEAELRRSRLITENIPIGLYLYHLEDLADHRTLRMTYANPAVKALTGLAPADLIGKTLDENFPDLGASGMAQRFAEVVRSQTAISIEEVVYGDARMPPASFAVRAFPLPGHHVGVAFENISGRKQVEDKLRESEDRYRDLVDYSHDLICTHDLQGRILSANPAVMKLLGIAPDALMKMNLRDIMAPEVRDQIGDYLATIRRDGKASGLMMIQTSTGEKRLWEYDNTLRTQGVAAPLVRGMARDITERKRGEAELKQKLAELQQWYEVMLGREERVLELKREADVLRQRLGEPPRYAAELADEQPAAGTPS